MRVLIACESSGVVREAFRKRGHDAWSCDLLPADDASPFHIQGDALATIGKGWDLIIGHPPCTDLAVSGARWWKAKGPQAAKDAIAFVKALWAAPYPRVCLENPVGRLSTLWMAPTQYVQPWMFGHGETKKTGLWIRGLPDLTPTNIVEGREARIHKMPPGPNRWKERSKTYQGIADAMAAQWG